MQASFNIIPSTLFLTPIFQADALRQDLMTTIDTIPINFCQGYCGTGKSKKERISWKST
jgi:hypothetical protein